MKKSSIIVLVIICIIIAIVIGGGITFISIQQNNTKHENQQTEDISKNNNNNVEQNENKNESNIDTKQSLDKTTNRKEKKRKYTNVALQGCVITESNSETGAVSYKKKCETCGEVQPGSTRTNLTGTGIMNSSFYCSKCKKTQKVEIETKVTYE